MNESNADNISYQKSIQYQFKTMHEWNKVTSYISDKALWRIKEGSVDSNDSKEPYSLTISSLVLAREQKEEKDESKHM